MCLYTHVARGMFNKSFSNQIAWNSGIVIIFLTIGTAFLGYVLPWGQISFWGASVITNLLLAIPYLGEDLAKWLWGGFSVGEPTLSRFFALHFILPLILTVLALIHLIFIHEKAASTPTRTRKNISKIKFLPFFVRKDLTPILIIILILVILVLQNPFILCDPENFTTANSIVTPPHILPEWYFLFAYAILRSIPNKLGGVIALIISIIILIILPLIFITKNKSTKFYPINKIIFWLFTTNFIILTWGGSQLVEQPIIITTQIIRVTYFLFFPFNIIIFKIWEKIYPKTLRYCILKIQILINLIGISK